MPGRDSKGEKKGEINCYLACFPARPIKLSRERPTTIGRSSGNTIVLADSDISRRHAVIEWKGDAFYIRDLGSRNGVWVNDKRITEAKLSPNDKILIGSRMLTFLEGDEQTVRRLFLRGRRERESSATDVITLEAASRPSPNLKGTLADFGLGELLQALELGRKTGKVTVQSGNVRGELWLRDGQVVRASSPDAVSEEAVYRLLALTEGHFEFESCPVEGEDEIRVKTSSLLMEGFRRMDEALRASSGAAASDTTVSSAHPAGVDPDEP